jgi:GNAT superfamily N-acetyltransferase
MQISIDLRTPIRPTPRVLQIEGLFDLPPSSVSEVHWTVDLPLDEKPWHIGLIVGPSGSGKSTLARRLWPEQMAYEPAWPEDLAVVDAFPREMSIKEIVALLSSVGFSSPPAWLRPYQVLSTGEQFRVKLARLLAETAAVQIEDDCGWRIANRGLKDQPPSIAKPTTAQVTSNSPVNPQSAIRNPQSENQRSPVVFDEFTSAVDRTVARIGAHALAKTVRARRQQFVAITSHADVEAWLNPDWVYNPATNVFVWRCLQRRPSIRLNIRRAGRDVWPIFQHHHYLNTGLGRGVVCFAAFWRGRPVAFTAWIQALTRHGGKREHRTVTLPDYQGVGIGHALSTYIGGVWKAIGYRATSTTSHPAMIAARRNSADWRLIRPPSLTSADRGLRRIGHARTRLTAGFEYVGPAVAIEVARKLIE